jgi:hypothetical protein
LRHALVWIPYFVALKNNYAERSIKQFISAFVEILRKWEPSFRRHRIKGTCEKCLLATGLVAIHPVIAKKSIGIQIDFFRHLVQ